MFSVIRRKGYFSCLNLQVFTGNKTTCMKVLPYQVQKIMTLVSIHLNKAPQFLDLLNAIVKVEELNLPLKRNQGYVMKYFMQYRYFSTWDEYLLVVLGFRSFMSDLLVGITFGKYRRSLSDQPFCLQLKVWSSFERGFMKKYLHKWNS